MHLKRLQSSLTQLARITQLPPLDLSKLCLFLVEVSRLWNIHMLVPYTNYTKRPTVKLNGLKGDKNSFKMPAARSHAHDFGYEALRLRAYGLLCISIFSRRINVCHYLTHLSTYIHTYIQALYSKNEESLPIWFWLSYPWDKSRSGSYCRYSLRSAQMRIRNCLRIC